MVSLLGHLFYLRLDSQGDRTYKNTEQHAPVLIVNWILKHFQAIAS